MTRFHITAACCLCWPLALAPTAHAQTKPTDLDNPLARLSLDQFSATRARPLFSSTRRSPGPSVVFASPVAEPPTPPPNLELYGTIIDGDEALAIVVSPSNKQKTRVRLGEEISGWKIDKIEERKLTLSLDGRFAEFMMYAAKPGEKRSAEASASDD